MKNFIICLLFIGFFQLSSNAQIFLDISEPISKQLGIDDTPKFVKMPQFDVQKLKKANEAIANDGIKPSVFAKSFDKSYALKETGNWLPIKEGKLWQIAFSSKGAYSLNLILSGMKIPEGAVIFAYTPGYKNIAGPFTSSYNTKSGILPIQPLPGQEIILEYFEPLKAEFEGKFVVSKISHDFTDILKTSLNKGFNDSGDCNVCINAPAGNAWQDEKRSVAKIIMGGNRSCSGALINNFNTPERPFFLTANHCIDNANEAASSVFMFQYENNCDGNNGPTYMVVNGSTRRANHANSDFCLLELDGGRVPSSYRPYFSGFSRSNTPPPNATGIHHPCGDVKKICVENDPLTSTSYQANGIHNNANHWRVANWDVGVTEGKSSGSPLYDNNSRIIGQLHGGFAACTGSNDNGKSDWYGKLFTSWEQSNNINQQLRFWLAGASNPTTMNGFSPQGWRHGWMLLDNGSTYNPKDGAKSIDVGEGNQVFFRCASNNKIYNYHWTNNQWHLGTISNNSYTRKVAGDLVVGENNHIFYRGKNSRIQTHYWNGASWSHGFVDSSSGSARKISDACGALVVGKWNHLFYKGTDGRMHTYYWSGSSWSHGYLPLSSNNWKVDGHIAVTEDNQIFYRGVDGKMQTYYWSDNDDQWHHGYLGNQQVSSACGSIVVIDGVNVVFRAADDWLRIYYKTGNGGPTDYGLAPITDWTNGKKVAGTIGSSGDAQIFYRGIDGKMRTYYWTNNGFVHDWIETSWQAPSQHSVKSNGAIAVGIGNQIFYKGSDNKMHTYFYDDTGFNRFYAGDNYGMDKVVLSPTIPVNTFKHTVDDVIDSQIYPNPARDEVTLDFNLSTSQNVSIKLFDTLGQEAITITETNLDAGNHSQIVDISTLNNGIYFCIIESEEGRVVKKLIIH